MSAADLYIFLLAFIIVAHRLPAVFYPRMFRRIYNRFAERISLIRVTGIILLLFSGWGIYENVADYEKLGWIIIGLSMFILAKSLGYIVLPRFTADADRRANNMSDRALASISLVMVMAGIAIVLMAF